MNLKTNGLRNLKIICFSKYYFGSKYVIHVKQVHYR